MKTGAGVPMTVGPISIPGVLSLLSTWPPNPNAVVLGYSSFVKAVQDPIWWISHDAYDLHAWNCWCPSVLDSGVFHVLQATQDEEGFRLPWSE